MRLAVPTLQEILRLTVQMSGREARILPSGAVGAALTGRGYTVLQMP